MVFLWPVEASDPAMADATQQYHTTAVIRIVDQYGRQAPTGKRDVGSQIFDVAVGPVANKFSFVPHTVNIRVGDTVRWTWESDSHSVTSGTSCTADGQFCSPANMDCEAGILNDKGFVYEYTFTEPGTYQYFCALHCFAAMTGVVNVMPTSRPAPTPRPRPTPGPRTAL
jgi:plastocyanin